MDDCCEHKAVELRSLRTNQKRVLQVVLAINAVFFLVEFVAGIMANSTALLADSLDMLGDSFVYGFSLYVLSKSAKWRAGAAALKGSIMALFGVGVLVEALLKLASGTVPSPEAMGFIGGLALAANFFCFVLLYRHRAEDLNMRSTWLCSRNDIFANLAVLIAAAGVTLFASIWPDIIVGVAIAALFLKSAFTVLFESVAELRAFEAPELKT